MKVRFENFVGIVSQSLNEFEMSLRR